jgi:hypothetical protein
MNNMKVINTQQARIIHHYKNSKEKLLKTNAEIWFNKMCRFIYITSKYIQLQAIHNAHNEQHENEDFCLFSV